MKSVFDRRGAYLGENKARVRPIYNIFLDTETRAQAKGDGVQEHYLSLCVSVSTRRDNRHPEKIAEKWFSTETASEWWDDLVENLPKRKRVYVWTHNAQFDCSIMELRTQAEKHGFIFRKFISGPLPFICDLWHPETRSTVRWVDSLNIFKVPLSVLGESIGIPKLEMPTSEYSEETKDEWTEYCKRDVNVLKEAILGWQNTVYDNEWGNFAPTIAGQAMNMFKHKYYRPKSILIHNNVEGCRGERKAYYGSRCEVFNTHKQTTKAWMVDYNSLFPAIMASTPMPVKYKGCQDREIKPETLSNILDHYAACALVEVSTDIPLVPYRLERLCWPIGTFTGWYSSPELELLLQHGAIKRVFKTYMHHKELIFDRFITDLYEYRRKNIDLGNDVVAYHAKLLMNSSYGRWGMRAQHWTTIRRTQPGEEVVDAVLDQDGTFTRYRERFRLLQELSKDEEAVESYPLIAASISAGARIKLFNAMQVAGKHNYYYCDTDSLAVNETGLRNLEASGLLHETELGKLKVQAECSNFHFRNNKDYRFNGKDKIKGVGNAREVSKNTYLKTIFQSMNTRISHNDPDGFVRTVDTLKHMERLYKKGIIDPETGWVEPLTLEQGQPVNQV